MPNIKLQDNLYNYCRWNETNEVVEILQDSNDIDILYEDGRFFDFAISENNYEIYKALLDYFEQKQFPIKNAEYEEAKERLIEILENATDSVKLSKEMKEVLSPYLDFDNDSDVSSNSLFDNVEVLHEFETASTIENTEHHEDSNLIGHNSD